jgi:hypothetical protein
MSGLSLDEHVEVRANLKRAATLEVALENLILSSAKGVK